jgi:hypothetical protein
MKFKRLKIAVHAPVIDRLAYILPRFSSYTTLSIEEVLKIIVGRYQLAVEEGLCKRAYTSGARYRLNFNIALPGGSDALVQIGALQPKVQKGDVRVCVNPARFGPDDVDHLNKVMRRIIGKKYPELMKRARLNCLDAAVDIHGLDLSTTLVQYQYATKHTVFGKRMANGSFIETYNFGSLKSAYMTTVYSKHIEKVHRAIINLVRTARSENESLKANAVKQVHEARGVNPITRVEIRGKKLRGLHLSQLPMQTNRFKWFKFACLDMPGTGTQLTPLLKQAFISMCRDTSVKATLAAFKGSKQANNVNNFWRSHQAEWWKPETLWLQACEAVREIGLFPDEAFSDPED